MREMFGALLTGLLFGLGLCLSSMTSPAVVQGVLDLAGDWNPTLVFVMVGGVTNTFVGYRLIWRRDRPLWAGSFQLPAAKAIDAPLLSGASLFGIGWGLAGYCPGPAVVSLASGRASVWVFVAAMLVGMTGVRWLKGRGSATIGKPATAGGD